MVSYDHFRQELRAQMDHATMSGAIDMLVTAGELFDAAPKDARADLGLGYCCDAMRDEMQPGDMVIVEHDNGSGMTVRFMLPRLQPEAIFEEASELDHSRRPLFGRWMEDDDYYRKQAADALQMADRSVSPIDKAAWLRLAQSWMLLVQRPTNLEVSERAENTD